jgi:hypothetical protein
LPYLWLASIYADYCILTQVKYDCLIRTKFAAAKQQDFKTFFWKSSTVFTGTTNFFIKTEKPFVMLINLAIFSYIM